LFSSYSSFYVFFYSHNFSSQFLRNNKRKTKNATFIYFRGGNSKKLADRKQEACDESEEREKAKNRKRKEENLTLKSTFQIEDF